LSEGDQASALEQIASAVALRDEVLRSLHGKTRDAYLSRRDSCRLSRLERLLDDPGEEEPSSTRPSLRGKPSDAGASFVGRQPNVRALLESVKRVARTNATVLVRGESGTGKELIAEALHAGSDRARGPLVKVNCAALVESLLLSELFGHEKGAFTGALTRKRGRFERASGGTLFLDEIGDISARTQVALLRVLEERSFERVGGMAAIPVDVRIVCATNRDLQGMVERGEFREDLYYRLSGITLEVPPLRERLADLPLLCDAILARLVDERNGGPSELSPEGLEILARHRWPGNVRELENALRAAALFAEGSLIEPADLFEHVEVLRKVRSEPPASASGVPAPFDAGRATQSAAPSPHDPARHEAAVSLAEPVTGAAYLEIRDSRVSLGELKRRIERDCIARALADTAGNITHAAALLGMKRPRLSQLVKQYGLLGEEQDS
jgi:transcriptional regulator with GAF, ATPase, and Fis domain